MRRTSRVPYHQNVYDLLQLGPGESAEAARTIESFELAVGPLPASVREWYLVPDAVPLRPGRVVEDWDVKRGTIWFEYSDIDVPVALSSFLTECWNVRLGSVRRHNTRIPRPFVRVISAHQGCLHWYVADDDSDDPPVWLDVDGTEWKQVAETFSEFLIDWLAGYIASPVHRTPISRHRPDHAGGFVLPHGPPFEKPYANGLWLRTPAEPFAVPIIDFLTEQCGEPVRTARPGDVTTYTFRPEGGTIRVTADDPVHPDPLSAWWIHGDTTERLEEFARLLLPWGTLRDTLRTDTDPARDVFQRVRARPSDPPGHEFLP